MRTNAILAGWLLAAGVMLSGCQSVIQSGLPDPEAHRARQADDGAGRCGRMAHSGHSQQDRVSDQRNPGTIIIDTGLRTISTTSCRTAKRSNIGSRPARKPMGWTGRATVGAMKEWPTWMPTASIMERWPQFKVYRPARSARGPVGQSARRARPVSLPGQPRHALSHPRHQRAVGDRPGTCPPAAFACATWT